ncbi:MAG TPA: hypothetical protein VNS57_15960 [Steroidobacteraceae bacterium]|nr:hypothetical protein [Steroidobacteraceae bacterium]
MVQAGRAAAGWLAGRALLFVLALSLLVLVDIGRDESSTLRTQAVELLPQARQAEQLAARRQEAFAEVDRFRQEWNERLQSAHRRSPAELAQWLARLDREIAERETRRLDAFELMLAADRSELLVEHAKNEATLQVLRWSRDELLRVMRGVATLGLSVPQAEQQLAQAHAFDRAHLLAYRRARADFDAFATAHPLAALIPFERLGIVDGDRQRYLELQRAKAQAARRFLAAREQANQAETTLRQVRATRETVARPLAAIDSQAMRALDALIAARQRAVEEANRGIDEVVAKAGALAWAALWVVVLLSLLPLVLKAFWYFVMAPMAARRPPIRLQQRGAPSTPVPAVAPAGTDRISTISLDIELGAGDELLVHPEYLQSLATAGRKATQWLLDPAYPVMSVAAGMVALTRIRDAAGERFTVSSRKDPLAEVGLVELADGARFVLQPRHLVGMVQARDRPVRIRSRWHFGLSAWITLQFRYLVFEGPGQLIVSGCRGVRQEAAGGGRAIDQAATIGFSAELDYVPRRSATFGAYLLGVNGLFDDGFAGGPGIYVYEEMPHYGKRSGITGRGLEGVTDVVLKAFGV